MANTWEINKNTFGPPNSSPHVTFAHYNRPIHIFTSFALAPTHPQQYPHNQTQQCNMTNTLVTPLTLHYSRDTYQRMQISTVESPAPQRM